MLPGLPAFGALIFGWLGLWNRLRVDWSINEQYEYGWFVPPLALALLAMRWKDRPPGRRVAHLAGWLCGLSAIFGLGFLLPIRLVEGPNPDWRLLFWLHALVLVGLVGRLRRVERGLALGAPFRISDPVFARGHPMADRAGAGSRPVLDARRRGHRVRMHGGARRPGRRPGQRDQRARPTRGRQRGVQRDSFAANHPDGESVPRRTLAPQPCRGGWRSLSAGSPSPCSPTSSAAVSSCGSRRGMAWRHSNASTTPRGSPCFSSCSGRCSDSIRFSDAAVRARPSSPGRTPPPRRPSWFLAGSSWRLSSGSARSRSPTPGGTARRERRRSSRCRAGPSCRPRDAPGFQALPIDERTAGMLRYDHGTSVRWDPAAGAGGAGRLHAVFLPLGPGPRIQPPGRHASAPHLPDCQRTHGRRPTGASGR